MTLTEIEKEWAGDCKFDVTRIIEETVRIPTLHAKYYAFMTKEKMLLLKYNKTQKELEHVLWQFYSKQLTSDELKEYGLEFPDKVVLRTDVNKWVEAHPDNIDIKLKIGVQHEKIEYLKSILSMISNRSFQIKHVIDVKKFEAGVV